MFLETEKRPQGEPSRENGAGLDDASKLLLKAAEVIERQGWCQNALTTDSGRVCLEGALSIAAFGHAAGSFNTPATREAFARLRDPVTLNAPHYWNDAPGRTKEEVVAKLRAVALGG